MKYRSFVFLAASLTLVGAGCEKISSRFEQSAQPIVTSTPEAAVPPDLTGAEYFLRSRDDVAPGQLDVTNQTLFAKTKNGQIVPVIKDVHEALGGKLLPTSFLVQVKELPQTLRYIYFVNGLENGGVIARQLFVFDTESKTFVDLPVTFLTGLPQITDFKFSPDHTKIAITQGVQGQIETIYIVDVLTGQVLNMVVVGEKQTVADLDVGANSSQGTKWIDNMKFAVVLSDLIQKSDEKNNSMETILIDTSTTLDTSKFEQLEYTYKSNIDTLFARPVDKKVATAVMNRVAANFAEPIIPASDVDDGDVKILSGVTQASPFVFFVAPIDFSNGVFAAIFEKRTGKLISTKPLEGKILNHSVLSKSGSSLAVFSMMEHKIDIRLVDLITLHSFEKSIDLEGFSPNESVFGMLNGEEFGIYGPNKWLDDKTFSFNLYEVVDITKKADKNGKFSVKQPLAKTIKIKFE